MDQRQLNLVKFFNETWKVGAPVVVEKTRPTQGRTICEATLRNDHAVVYLDSMIGPVPIGWIKPMRPGGDL
jgi:hypothetical protein